MMIQTPNPRGSWPRGAFEAVGGPVTCAVCGCRLQSLLGEPAEVWTHFNPIAGRDARGCRVDCVDLPHDATGRALAGRVV